jgi:hypothetical protein
LLNSVFFSPRYAISRFNLLNPATYIKMSPKARAEALKNVGVYIGVAAMAMAIAKAGGAEVEMDPRSTDFGKIKVGDTRYDILAGLQQWVRLISQVVSGEKKTIAGDVQELSDPTKYKPDTRADVIERFLRSKAAPIPGAVGNWLYGTDLNGKPVKYKFGNLKEFFGTEEGRLIAPLWITDLIGSYDQLSAGQDAANALLSFFGLGIQTYAPKEPSKKELEDMKLSPRERRAKERKREVRLKIKERKAKRGKRD